MAEAGTQAPASVRPSPSRFTALELAAAEHLIHLSESSGSSAAAFFGPASVGSAASSSSSPRSVNAPVVPRCGGGLAALAAAEDDEDDEQEVGGRRRRNKRYRPIAEIYAATEPKPVGARGGRKEKDRPKQAAGAGKQEARK
ncbi:hypothetical protein PR202_gb02412 [Eleusine coracana subsp. coracana]|uniref:Uncharacterized protein n=1 Tax=Eleusine coracana subsp. coracana TaxID=191504 RepID=A0AAV5DYZ5_ELECO|nr:hypothetical protein PR202_gb02412 [Eleusine coracana subsp. coracana]